MEILNHWIQNDGVAIVFIAVGATIIYLIGEKLIALLIKQAVKGKGRGQPRKDIEKRQKTLVGLSVNMWRIVVIAVAGISAMRIAFPAIDFSPLFASAGIVGVAIAFGSQTLVKDFITGLFIVSENQYRVGDVVEINSAEGRVEQVGARSTVIRDFDGNVHYLPNGSIVHVVNKTMGYSRVNFTLSVSTETDLDKAIKLINTTGSKLAEEEAWSHMVIEAPQFDSIKNFSKSAIEISIVGKVQPSDQWKVTAEMRRRLLSTFADAKDIELA